MPLSDDALPENSHIVHPKFLDNHSSKKDLIRRLRKLAQVLQDDTDIDCDSPEWPGLAAVALSVVSFLQHPDKQVRLYAVLCCTELFAVYAPEKPWDEEHVLLIFAQMTRQLANLGHTTEPSHPNYACYVRMLQLLQEVRIGIVLCEMIEEKDQDEGPLDVLTELIHTLLHAVRNEHAHVVTEAVVATVCSCLDWLAYHCPIKLLDEILHCLAQGPHMPAVPTTNAKVANPTYSVAAAVVSQLHNKLTTPISQLLNGLLNGDSHVREQSSLSKSQISNVIGHLHQLAPNLLTTILGTVAQGLRDADPSIRLESVQLLGLLFGQNDSTAKLYSSCYSDWLGRSQDVNADIRKGMIPLLCQIMVATNDEVYLQALQTIVTLLQHDPSLEIRMEAIHHVSDWIYRSKNETIHPDLVRAIGNRVSAKNAQERRDALTGLAQIYARKYLQIKLANVDEEQLNQVLLSVHDACHLQSRGRRSNVTSLDVLDEAYGWIPSKVLESACFTDTTDSEMRSRVVQIMDDILLRKLQPNAAVTGITIILSSLREPGDPLVEVMQSNACKFLMQLLRQRSRLQTTLSKYIEARAQIHKFKHGSEEKLAANAQAKQLLEHVAALSAPPADNLAMVLQSFHEAKDKYIFQSLAIITNPMHSAKARAKLLADVPKRCQGLDNGVVGWVKDLIRRCAMGDAMNRDIVRNAVVLAHEAFLEHDIPACSALLLVVRIAVDTFPTICGIKKTYATLKELFTECRTTTDKVCKKEIEEYGLITLLSCILSAATPSDESKDGKIDYSTNDDFQKQLVQICTRDGTPEQARNAVYTLTRVVQSTSQDSSSDSGQIKVLVQQLTSPTRLSVRIGAKESKRLVSTLCALAALSECAPEILEQSGRCKSLIKFALETVLMGRGGTDDDDDASSGENDSVANSTSPKEEPGSAGKKFQAFKHSSPEAKGSLMENENLSFECRRTCAAIDFLVCFARSRVLASRGCKKESQPLVELTLEQIRQIFDLLLQILRDSGLPPSSRDRKMCKSRQDRAALRQSAGTNLLRLCDPRLELEKKILTPDRWLTLSEVFVDEEFVVRDAILDEFCTYLKRTGVYKEDESHMLPSLRFVALSVLCVDGEHEHDKANGNAANVGKKVGAVKAAVLSCVSNLRKACEVHSARSKALGDEAEEKFESQLKMLFMPEYLVPFAFFLLSQRRETPIAGVVISNEVSNDSMSDVGIEITNKDLSRILRKRLSLIFNPLVQSLGDGADNITFLLRMSEILGKNFSPIDMNERFLRADQSPKRSPLKTVATTLEHRHFQADSLDAKLTRVCSTARQVLLSHVKKDVNLATYPGKIQFPSTLFARKWTPCQIAESLRLQQSTLPNLSPNSNPGKVISKKSAYAPPLQTPRTERYLQSPKGRPSSIRNSTISKALSSQQSIESLGLESPSDDRRVHFSPETFKTAHTSMSFPKEKHKITQASPFTTESLPVSVLASATQSISSNSDHQSSAETLGSSPPSALLTTTLTPHEVDDGLLPEKIPDVEQNSSMVKSLRPSRESLSPPEMQTSSETFTSQESEHTAEDGRARRAKQKRSSISQHVSDVARCVASKKFLPKVVSTTQIKLNRVTSIPAMKGRKRTGVSYELDFDSDDERENNSRTIKKKKSGAASKENSVGTTLRLRRR